MKEISTLHVGRPGSRDHEDLCEAQLARIEAQAKVLDSATWIWEAKNPQETIAEKHLPTTGDLEHRVVWPLGHIFCVLVAPLAWGSWRSSYLLLFSLFGFGR